LRSPATDVFKRAKVATKEANDDPVKELEASITFICECTVAPAEVVDQSNPASSAYRTFWETTGAVIVALAQTHVQTLGGFQQDAFKRATRAAT
jgi:hypothetical protein